MKGKDKGFSLIELIVVIGMMAVALTVGGLALTNISLANAKGCATEIKTSLEMLRMESTRKISGNAPSLYIYKKNGDIYLKVGSADEEKIGNSNVSIKYRSYNSEELIELGETTAGTTDLKFTYVKSTGGFKADEFAVDQIVVSSASREYVITLYKHTGKVKMD